MPKPPARSNSSTPSAAALISAAMDRNAPIELHFHSNDGELTVLKSRILGVSDDGLLELDMPHSIGHEIDFKFGLVFDGHMSIGQTRYMFRSRIRNLMQRIELNKTKRLVGITCSMPSEIKPGQRRNDFRVSMASTVSSAVLTRAIKDDEEEFVCPLGFKPEPARIVDLSLGGAAILLPDDSTRRPLRINDFIFLEFLTPKDVILPSCLMEVRQLDTLPRKGGVRIGAQLKTWPDGGETRAWQRAAQSYLNELERERIKRQRKAS